MTRSRISTSCRIFVGSIEVSIAFMLSTDKSTTYDVLRHRAIELAASERGTEDGRIEMLQCYEGPNGDCPDVAPGCMM